MTETTTADPRPVSLVRARNGVQMPRDAAKALIAALIERVHAEVYNGSSQEYCLIGQAGGGWSDVTFAESPLRRLANETGVPYGVVSMIYNNTCIYRETVTDKIAAIEFARFLLGLRYDKAMLAGFHPRPSWHNEADEYAKLGVGTKAV